MSLGEKLRSIFLRRKFTYTSITLVPVSKGEVPDFLRNIYPRDHPALIAGEVFQQGKFLRRELDVLPGPFHAHVAAVDLQIGYPYEVAGPAYHYASA